MLSAGQLRERVRFEQRSEDDNGDRLGDWAGDLTVSARIQPLKGSETALAERLQGSQPVVIYIRASSATRAIDNAWRGVNARSGQVYEISSALLSEDRSAVEVLATAKTGALA